MENILSANIDEIIAIYNEIRRATYHCQDDLEKLFPIKEKANNFFKSIGDTYYGMFWIDFVQLCKRAGFEEVYKKDFTSKLPNSPVVTTEEEIVLIKKDMGLIIHAYSESNKQGVSCANLIGEIKLKETKNENKRFPVFAGYCIERIKGGLRMDINIEIGMLSSLALLEKDYNFSQFWSECVYTNMLLLNPMDYLEKSPLKREKINDAKIRDMGPEILDITGYVPKTKNNKFFGRNS